MYICNFIVPSFPYIFLLWLRKLRHMNVIDYKHSWLEIDRHSELCPYVPFLYILMVTRINRSNWEGNLGCTLEKIREIEQHQEWKEQTSCSTRDFHG